MRGRSSGGAGFPSGGRGRAAALADSTKMCGDNAPPRPAHARYTGALERAASQDPSRGASSRRYRGMILRIIPLVEEVPAIFTIEVPGLPRRRVHPLIAIDRP